MQRLAQQLPEYPVVMAMYGVGDSVGPKLMAEIGDVRRFANKRALVAYAGIDPQPSQSGKFDRSAVTRNCSARYELAIYHCRRTDQFQTFVSQLLDFVDY